MSCLRWISLTLWRQRRRYGLTVAAVALILVVLHLLNVTAETARRYVDERVRRSVGGDVVVGSFQRITDPTRAEIFRTLEPIEVSEQLETTVMVGKSESAVFVELRSYDSHFPLTSGMTRTLNTEGSSGLPQAWVQSDTLDRLDLRLGDTVQVGSKEFQIAQVVKDDPGFSQTSFGAAPRIYIPHEHFDATGLAGVGSQVFHRLYFRLADDKQAHIAQLRSLLSGRGFFTRTPDEGSRFIGQALQYFLRLLAALTLILVSLALLFLSGKTRHHLSDWRYLSTLVGLYGAPGPYLQATWCFIVFGGFALMYGLSWGLVAVATPGLEWLLGHAGLAGLSLPLPQFLAPSTITLAAGLALFTAWQGARAVSRAYPRALVQAEDESPPRDLMSLVLGSALLAVFAVEVFDHLSWGLGAWMGITGITLIVMWFHRELFSGVHKTLKSQNLRRQWVWLQLARAGFRGAIFLVCLYTVFASLTSLLTLRHTFLSELVTPVQGRPSLFVINIPEEQRQELEDFLRKEGAPLENVSPFILGQLTRHNGEKVRNPQLLQFPTRLSYRGAFLESESIAAGSTTWGPFQPDQGLPWISVETRYAQRNGFALGDRLAFDVQGVEVTAQIHSLRQVRWTSFQPNFFIQFQPGVLDDAPRTWIGTVQVSSEQLVGIQKKIVKTFPGVSVINLQQAIAQGAEVANTVAGISSAVIGTSLLAVLLLALALLMQELSRKSDQWRVLVAIGLQVDTVETLLRRELGVQLLFAVAGGSLLGLLGGSLASQSLLSLPAQTPWLQIALFTSGLVLLLAGVVVYVARSAVRKELSIKS